MKRIDKFVEFGSAQHVVKEREGGGTVGVEINLTDELGQNISVAMDYRNFVIMIAALEKLKDTYSNPKDNLPKGNNGSNP